jgi:hypothetical protein
MTVEKVTPPKKPTAELQKYGVEHGSMTGMLNLVNLNKNPNIFYIYPTYNHRKIKCKFAESLLEQVKEALGKYVEVRGKILYKMPSSVFDQPHEMEVEEIEILESENAVTLASLRGIAKGALGNKTSEEYVRELRDEWQ